MDNATNTIIRCKGICQRKLDKFQEAYNEADASFRDTGYDRYWNKMRRIKAEMDELKIYCNTKQVIAEHERSKQRANEENQRLRKVLETCAKILTEGDFNSASLAEYIIENIH